MWRIELDSLGGDGWIRCSESVGLWTAIKYYFRARRMFPLISYRIRRAAK